MDINGLIRQIDGLKYDLTRKVDDEKHRRDKNELERMIHSECGALANRISSIEQRLDALDNLTAERLTVLDERTSHLQVIGTKQTGPGDGSTDF